MIQLVADNLPAIRALAERYGVARLELFGSAATDAFDPERSDVDFLVEFPPDYEIGPWLSRFFDLEADLSALLGRKVDLVMAKKTFRNPYFARSVEATRRLLYAA